MRRSALSPIVACNLHLMKRDCAGSERRRRKRRAGGHSYHHSTPLFCTILHGIGDSNTCISVYELRYGFTRDPPFVSARERDWMEREPRSFFIL